MRVETAKRLLNFGVIDSYEEVTPELIERVTHWSVWYNRVYKNTSDGTYWEVSWSLSAPAYHNNGVEDVTVRRVKPTQKTITVYEGI